MPACSRCKVAVGSSAVVCAVHNAYARHMRLNTIPTAQEIETLSSAYRNSALNKSLHEELEALEMCKKDSVLHDMEAPKHGFIAQVGTCMARRW